jgi:adenine/guanine phosphoribosyltransferase-like PRPP-binding protein
LSADDGGGALQMRWTIPDYKRMSRQDRLSCNAGRFTARDVHGAHCLLLDDVITTGAQSGDCRQALEAAGARPVTVVSLAVSPSRRRDGALTLTRPIERPRRLVRCSGTPPARTIPRKGEPICR